MRNLYGVDLPSDTKHRVQRLYTRHHRLEARCLEIDFLGFRSDWKPKNAPSSKKYTSYGVFDNNRIIATTRVSHSPLIGWSGEALQKLRQLDPEVFIVATVVDPDYRGQGIARALRDRLKQDFDRILTGTCDISDPAIHYLNRQQGFQLLFQRGQNAQWFWSRNCENVETSAGAAP